MRISARGISKRFGAIASVADVTFDVAPGECLGVAGGPGSGRTTLLQILATLIQPSSGSLVIGDMDAARQLAAIRRQVAYAGSTVAAGAGLRVAEYLRFVLHTRGAGAGIEHTRRVRESLQVAGIGPSAMIDVLPSADRATVAMAAALLVRPGVLILDEAIDAMPVDVRARFVECIAAAQAAGSTIVLATNDEAVLASVCDRALRMEGGRAVPGIAALPRTSSVAFAESRSMDLAIASPGIEDVAAPAARVALARQG